MFQEAIAPLSNGRSQTACPLKLTPATSLPSMKGLRPFIGSS
jgi:hypothetical protein